MKKLKITRTVSIAEEVPFTSEYYPNYSIEEAKAVEESSPPSDGWGEYFFDADTLEYSTKVEIVEED